jgi:P27 family predicted phage terminase small subunit
MGRRGPLKRGQTIRFTTGETACASVAGDDSLLTPPKGMPPGAATIYRRLAPILLADKRLLAETQATLVTYCRLSDEADRIADTLEELGGVARQTPHGIVIDPRCKMLAGLRTTLLKYATALGLDPAGRARLQSVGAIQAPRTAEEIEADRAFEELLGRGQDARRSKGLA